ncbi:NGG1p interacting factor 3 [Rickenella mellea]|uniref:NGG1p interacting factor 3 n=1 Tax=Rickenella mellea TaxID=50990 RepID=A0A4Y7QFB6_9AGAM|nr:NGG1p interacting factor 3 [Rickenella mellea]
MERIAPLRLAESWDNVGLLLEAPSAHGQHKNGLGAESLLLTIDLTPPVVREAIAKCSSVIISYHPPIFKPLQSLTLSNPLQASILQCIQAGISIYSPHTALDSVRGGVNDWLAQGLGGGGDNVQAKALQELDESGAGSGRLLELTESISLEELVQRAKRHLRVPQVQVAQPHFQPGDQQLVKSVAICAGSGGSMLNGVEADVYFTGEMSHHEVLAAIANERTVILCGHTNTERGYLNILAKKLVSELAESKESEKVEVLVSKEDRHPLKFV